MDFRELLVLLDDRNVFTTGFLLAGQSNPAHVRRQLDRWVKRGKIIMLRRGVYVLAQPYASQKDHPFVLANAMRKSSYVSLQSALAHYGMIPEFTPVTTSVTTSRPEEIVTPLGRYIFRHVQRRMFFGMREIEVAPGQIARMATPEKAVIDLLYLTPRSDEMAYLEELRLEPSDHLNVKDLRETAIRCGSAKVIRAVEKLVALWKKQGWEEGA